MSDYYLNSVHLSFAVQIITVLLGGLFYLYLDAFKKGIYYYACLLLFSEWMAEVFNCLLGYNLIGFPVYCFMEVLLLTWLYNYCFYKKPVKATLWLGAAAAVYIAWEFLYSFILNPYSFYTVQLYCKVAGNFVVIVMALYFFYQRLGTSYIRRSIGMTNSIFLMFFSVTTIFWLPFNFIINAPTDILNYIYMVHGYVLLLFYIYLLVIILRNGITNYLR